MNRQMNGRPSILRLPIRNWNLFAEGRETSGRPDFETTYQELKHNPITYISHLVFTILRLPIRNWNFKKNNGKAKPRGYFETTYQELKLSSSGAVGSGYNPNFETTYQELKQTIVQEALQRAN